MKRNILLLGSLLLVVFSILYIYPKPLHTWAGMDGDTSNDLSGNAWSLNTGWISFNGTTSDGTPYGVDYNPTTGALTGYAWSFNLGWIDFAHSLLDNAPAGCTSAKMDTSTGNLSGCVKAIAGSGTPGVSGFDGWIILSGTANDGSSYGPTYNKTTQSFSGYAWAPSLTGWISFSGTADDGSAYAVKGPADFGPSAPNISSATASCGAGATPTITVAYGAGDSNTVSYNLYRCDSGSSCSTVDKAHYNYIGHSSATSMADTGISQTAGTSYSYAVTGLNSSGSESSLSSRASASVKDCSSGYVNIPTFIATPTSTTKNSGSGNSGTVCSYSWTLSSENTNTVCSLYDQTDKQAINGIDFSQTSGSYQVTIAHETRYALTCYQADPNNGNQMIAGTSHTKTATCDPIATTTESR